MKAYKDTVGFVFGGLKIFVDSIGFIYSPTGSSFVIFACDVLLEAFGGSAIVGLIKP